MPRIGDLEDNRQPKDERAPEITMEAVKEWWDDLDDEPSLSLGRQFATDSLYSNRESTDLAVVREQFRRWCIENHEKEILDWLSSQAGRLET